MKRVGLLFLMAFTVLIGIQAADKSKAKIKFEETVHDFGNIREDGGAVTYEFKFINEGKDPLKITNATAQCGCTRPEFPKNEIKPGEGGVIKVTFNPLGRPGGFTKIVTVRCEGNPGKVNLKIRGTVVPKDSYKKGDLSFVTTTANFGEITRGLKSKNQISYYNTGHKTLNPTFSSDSDALTLSAEPASLNPGEKGILTIYLDTTRVTWLGAKQFKIKGKCDNNPDVEINVKAIVLPASHSEVDRV